MHAEIALPSNIIARVLGLTKQACRQVGPCWVCMRLSQADWMMQVAAQPALNFLRMDGGLPAAYVSDADALDPVEGDHCVTVPCSDRHFTFLVWLCVFIQSISTLGQFLRKANAIVLPSFLHGSDICT